MRLLRTLWKDDCGGGLLSSELLFLYTTLVLGSISGLVAMRHALLSELVESGQALLALNQSYSFSGQANSQGSTGGSSATDMTNTITLTSVAPSNAVITGIPLD